MTHLDEVGNPVLVGDTWVATVVHAGRGVTHWMFQERMTVTAVGRTRVTVTTPNNTGTFTVGSECGKVVQAVDGRALRDWSDVHAERAAGLHGWCKP